MKENENPIIHAVKRRRQRQRSDTGADEDELSKLSSSDKSIMMALAVGICETKAFDENSIIQDAMPELFGMNDIDLRSLGDVSNLNLGPPQLFPPERSDFMDTADSHSDLLDADEIFDLLRDINDPEHPNLTLEQLSVVQRDLISVRHNEDESSISQDNRNHHSYVDVQFTPTIPHCSMATLIGLSLRVKLLRSLPSRVKCSVSITPGTHASESAINKQLADKERVAAALENKHLLGVVNKCLA